MEFVNGKWQHTEEEKQKAKQATQQLIWITNGIECKRHSKEEPLPTGYWKGRSNVKWNQVRIQTPEANEKRRQKLLGRPSPNKGHTSPKKGFTEAEYYGEKKANELAELRSEIHTGKIPWNKGIAHSQETKEQISLTKLSGTIGDHSGFKDGAKGKAWAIAVFNRDSCTCQHCATKLKLCAHHIKDWETFTELRIVVSNGLTLCNSCHMRLERRLIIVRSILPETAKSFMLASGIEVCFTCHRLKQTDLQDIKICSCN